MSVKNRLKEYIKYKNMAISDFEKSINASNGYINSINKSIGLDKLSLLVEKYSNLNLEWLLIGKGEMIKSERSEEHTSELQSRENLVCRLLLEKKNNNSSRS